MLHITALTQSLSAGFLFLSGLILLKSYKQEKTHLLKYFSVYLFGLGGANFAWAIASLVTGRELFLVSWVPLQLPLAGVFYLIGMLSGFIGAVYVTKLVFLLLYPAIAEIAFKIVVTGGILLFLFLSFFIPSPTLSPQGVIQWNVSSISATILIFGAGMITATNVVTFCYLGCRAKEMVFKVRGILIALGMVVYMTAGLMHNIALSVPQYIIAGISTSLGAGVIMVGIYTPKIIDWIHEPESEVGEKKDKKSTRKTV